MGDVLCGRIQSVERFSTYPRLFPIVDRKKLMLTVRVCFINFEDDDQSSRSRD